MAQRGRRGNCKCGPPSEALQYGWLRKGAGRTLWALTDLPPRSEGRFSERSDDHLSDHRGGEVIRVRALDASCSAARIGARASQVVMASPAGAGAVL